MNKDILTPKPIQAGDYGKTTPKKPKSKNETKGVHTDGRKTLALWKN